MSVDIFNKLPRRPRAPSGRVPNVWHFDIRYIQLQPPSHMVFLLQPESSFIHTELVPVGQPQDLGFTFFPDTAKEAAVEIAKALIHAFVTGLGNAPFQTNPPPPYAPWSFTTDDQGLAKEVGAELKRLGVKAPELCDVKFTPQLTQQAHAAFCRMFESMKTAIGFGSMAHAVFVPPNNISFLFELGPWVKPQSDETEAAFAYCQRLSSARPTSTDREIEDLMKEVQVTMAVLGQRNSATVRAEADAGNPQAALEYSLRLQYGIQCSPSRSLCRQYLIKVILNANADDAMKSIAHSLLIDWYIRDVFVGNGAPARYAHAAAHSADEAVRLSSGIASPAVLFFAFHFLDKQASQVPELYAQYKHVWEAKDKRELEVAVAEKKTTLKRMKQPNRYMCANVGCPVASNSGHMLSKCSGKCDQDRKPSYCGRVCQRADWTNHKPFCRPGAPCSVIERPEVQAKGYSTTKDGAIEVPIKNPDGTTTIVSSSTMSPELLKDVKAHVEAAGTSRSGPGFSGGITVGMQIMNFGDAGDSVSEID